MLIEDLNHILGIWIKELEQYDFIQLCAKPSPDSWSLGQMYRHLIDDARYYIQQIEFCINNNDHSGQEATAEARAMFLNNDFPNEALRGSPANAFIPQPDSREQLLQDLLQLRSDLNNIAVLISESPFHGKTRHPGFDYFSAPEWLQFAEMHFRHHLRQKQRIDHFLKTVNLTK